MGSDTDHHGYPVFPPTSSTRVPRDRIVRIYVAVVLQALVILLSTIEFDGRIEMEPFLASLYADKVGLEEVPYGASFRCWNHIHTQSPCP